MQFASIKTQTSYVSSISVLSRTVKKSKLMFVCALNLKKFLVKIFLFYFYFFID